MYYDDQTRRFNFVSGLLFGAVLGAGLALLASPQDRVRSLGPSARKQRTWKRKTRRRLNRLREGVADTMADAVATGRRRILR